MEYLYVCHFSNGHIKVGRSIDPQSRIAAHAERVSCVGIELIEHQIFECVGNYVAAERALIGWCRDNCEVNNKNEWFVGLAFDATAKVATECAALEQERQQKADLSGVPIYMDGGQVNWPVVIDRLVKIGFTQQELAQECNTRQSTISDLFNGRTAEPNYSRGRKLLDMLMSVGDNTQAA